MRRVLVFATGAAAIPSLILLLVLEPLLGAWISKDFAAAHLPLARGITVAFCLLALNVPAYFLLFGLGRARFSSLVGIAAGIVLLSGCLLLSPTLWSFVFMKGIFAALTLSQVGYVYVLSREKV